jgi:gliding motility-associated-like protein
MKTRLITSLLVLLGVCYAGLSFAQNVAACSAAQNICNSPNFQFTSGGFSSGLPNGLNVSNPGTNPQLTNAAGGPQNSGCLLSGGPGPQWLLITVGSSGNLGFSFGANGSPNPQAGFYDWAMWPYTAATCNGIFNNTLPPVSCNWNGSSTGGTGMGSIPAGGSASNFQPSIPVTAGQQFLILVSNYSGVTTQVSFNSTGTAGLSCSPLIIPSATACPGQPAVVTATLPGIANPQYTLMPGGIVQTSPTFTVSAMANTVYTVIASGINSSASTYTTSNTFSLTINPTTTLAIINPTNYCNGTSITFTANPVGAIAYTVNGPAGFNQTYPTNQIVIPNAQPTGTGTYSIQAAYASGCLGTGTTAVNVSPTTALVVSNNTNVCQGSNVNLTASLATATAYSWSGPNSYVTAVQNPLLVNALPVIAGIYTVTSNLNFLNKQCPRSATVQVNVVATAPVQVSASSTLCQGSTLNLSANALGATSYSWSGPNVFSSGVPNPTITSLLPVNAGVYNAAAFFTNGIITCSTTTTTNLGVVATAPVALTVPTNICQEATANLNAVAAGAVGFSWNGPSNFTSNTSNPSILSIQPSASGNYSATATFALGTYSCYTSAASALNVVATSSISVNSPIVKCQKEQTQFLANAINGITYAWSGPNGYTAAVSSPVLTNLTTTVSGIYSITASFNNGILTCYRTNTLDLTVNPILEFTLTPNTRVCYNSNVNISGPAGGTSYLWTSTNSFSSTSQNLIIPNVSTIQDGTYFLEVSLGNCKTNGTTTLEVISPINFSVVPQNKTVCLGDSVKHFVSSTGGTENYAYNWVPSAYLSHPTGSVQEGLPLGTTVYQLTGWDIACPQYSVNHTFTVTVNQPPKPDLKLEKTNGCAPLCLLFDTHTDRDFSRLVTWDLGEIKKQGDSIEVCISRAGTYDLNILINDSNNCSSKTTLKDYITVFPLPGTEIQIPPDISTTNNLINFTSTSLNGPIISYYWQFGDPSDLEKDTSTLATPSHLYDSNKPGSYTVFLETVNEFGCKELVTKTFDLFEEFNFFIPNTFTPNGDGLNETFHPKGVGFREKGFVMDIFDRWGTRVYSTNEFGKGWDGTVKGSPAANGVYIYKIRVATQGNGKREFAGHVNLIR